MLGLRTPRSLFEILKRERQGLAVELWQAHNENLRLYHQSYEYFWAWQEAYWNTQYHYSYNF
ncbi:hypothetical protein N7468_008343 [Penicillium chermesinum]|uniref:Uncharacterized protein n=1 Tax=Penicillium chermesinum TaxID=63820 RepID=A0A9W9NPK4_9EURO|nr:uncharacterized protein N7468_008343 [Penicillium chermesinum]KAJ5223801.1 hypothetical protein N7468_008343 [Penicillium chermesinum]KAJ6155374.1 hypothetical protein N7470_005940 [Penicillium chermesinum]